jgi:hypothetical protein
MEEFGEFLRSKPIKAVLITEQQEKVIDSRHTQAQKLLDEIKNLSDSILNKMNPMDHAVLARITKEGIRSIGDADFICHIYTIYDLKQYVWWPPKVRYNAISN